MASVEETKIKIVQCQTNVTAITIRKSKIAEANKLRPSKFTSPCVLVISVLLRHGANRLGMAMSVSIMGFAQEGFDCAPNL